MRSKKNFLSILMLGIMLTATASQLKAIVGFGVGVGGRRGGVSVGFGAGPYYGYPYCDGYDCDYYPYYSGRYYRRGYPYRRRFYRGRGRRFHHRGGRGRRGGHGGRGGRGGRGRRGGRR